MASKRQLPKVSLSIGKEIMNSLPIERYEGKIVIVSSEDSADKAIADLKKHKVIGFDTETKPSFRKGMVNNVALMQLATENKSYLIRLSKIGKVPDSLKEFLEDETFLKIGLSIKDDFHNLNKLKAVDPKGFIDLQSFVKEFGIIDNSLTKIYSIIFGKRISKNQQLSNWEAPSLTDAQKHYASLDAAACLNIYNRLVSGDFHPKNSPYIIPDEEED